MLPRSQDTYFIACFKQSVLNLRRRKSMTSQSLSRRKPVIPKLDLSTAIESRRSFVSDPDGSSMELLEREAPYSLGFRSSHTAPTEAAFGKCLAIWPIFDSIAESLHFRDMFSLCLVSKALRQGIINATGSIDYLRDQTCRGNVKSSCWCCRKQICDVRPRKPFGLMKYLFSC